MYINSGIGSISNLYSAGVTPSRQSARTQQVLSFKGEMKLSAESQSTNALLKKLRQMSEVRRDRIEEISARIEDGSYFASADDIAFKMLSVQF